MAAYLSDIVEVEHMCLECPEFRHSDVREIAKGKAHFAHETLRRPLIVDDTAFCIDALHGFPGPYAAYVLDTLGNPGILKLMDGIRDRNAHFITAIAFADDRGIAVFTGRIDGRIVSPRGTGGFGYDPIFEVGDRTLAELTLAEKSSLSHRGIALAAFASWMKEERIRFGQKS